MSKHVEYREYTISSSPLHLLESGKWRPEIVNSSEREGVVTARPYADETTYLTEEAADNHGIQLGQDIIDGKAPELSGNYDENELKHEHHFVGFRVTPFSA
jgi:hypothetical protein